MALGGMGAMGATRRGGFGSGGALGRSGTSSGPTAPVLAIISLTTDNTPEFTIDVDDTVVAGDSVRLQVQAAGGDWSSPVSDTTHVITSGEDAANEVDLALTALANGNYEARANVTHTTVSSWSNTVSFTIAAVSSNFTATYLSSAAQ
jgi:hypothetical protein